MCPPVCFARVPSLTLNPHRVVSGRRDRVSACVVSPATSKENTHARTHKYPRKKEGECSRFFDSYGPSGFLIGVMALLLFIVQMIIDVVRVCGSVMLDVACAGPQVYP